MIKRFVIALVLLVLVCGGLVGFNIFRDRAIEQFFANMPVQPATVSTTIVEPVTWTPLVQAIGTASATQGVDLTVEAAGFVEELRFDANDRVEQGAVLVQLDDAMHQADLAAAQAQAGLDKTNLDRALELQRRQVGSEVNVESARAAAQASEAQVARAQAALDQKQLTAPFGGVIGLPQVVVGQYITPGTIVATLQDLAIMRVDFTVPEQQLNLLKIGQQIRLGVGENETFFTGTIRGIDPKIDPQTRLVAVRGEVANPNGQLSPGQFVEVRVELPEEQNVLTLPQTAVVTSLYGDYVYVVRPAGQNDDEASPSAPAAQGEPAPTTTQDADDQEVEKPSLTVHQTFVKTERRTGGRIEITDGISAGDQVVTAGQNRLSNGTPVTIDNTIDLANDETPAVAQ